MDQRDFASDNGEYGKEWAKKYKNDWDARPSINDIVEGIKEWFVRQTQARMAGLPQSQ